MEDPQLFSEYGGAYRRLAAELLDELWPCLSWPDHMTTLPALDVGCGPGDITAKILLPRLPPSMTIVGADVSPAMVEFARQHNAVPRVTSYMVLDIMDADVTKSAVWQYAPFSKVFSIMVLHWVPDNRRALQNIHKLLAPSGELLVTLQSSGSLFEVYRLMESNPRWSEYMKDVDKYITPYHYSKNPAEELRKLLLEEGFDVIHLRAEPRPYIFTSEKEARGALASVNSFLRCIPDKMREMYIDEYLDTCYKLKTLTKEKNEDTDSIKIFYNYTSMTAVARKRGKSSVCDVLQ